MECKVEHCNKKTEALGYCSWHYRQYKKYGVTFTKEEMKQREKERKTKNYICEVCGSNYRVFEYKKSKMLLCDRHRGQMDRYGKILNRTKFDENEIIVYDNYAEIVLYDKNGDEKSRAIIDVDKVDLIKKYKWCEDSCGYAKTEIDGSRMALHRFLMNPPMDMQVDHINRNRLDCRIKNLRICSQKDNNKNNTVKANSKTQERGIYLDIYNKYESYITVDKKKIHLGRFEKIEDAISARKEGENKYFGEFAPIDYNEDLV